MDDLYGRIYLPKIYFNLIMSNLDVQEFSTPQPHSQNGSIPLSSTISSCMKILTKIGLLKSPTLNFIHDQNMSNIMLWPSFIYEVA